MKKYLISGFNTVQDIKLEVGTYTLVAYVKSMYSNVYTFALGDGVTWTEYNMDVVKGQLCKVWLTFTIDKKATKFKPIANNFTESLPVYVTDLQLTKGNIPVEAGASPFDVDKILNDLHDKIDGIEDFTDGAFKDGILSAVEKTQLRASLDAIGAIVESVKGSYNKLLDNPFISNNTMANITIKYNAFIDSWISDTNPRGLKSVILWIINGDDTITPDERDEKDRALNAFNNALYAYNQAEKGVYNDIGASIDKTQADANVALAKTAGFTQIGDVSFPEGLIFTSLIKLLDAGNNGDEMAGISGIAGVNKEDPAFWAGGSYDQAFGGTAKAIIRHDGSSKFTDTEITGTVNATSGKIGVLNVSTDGSITTGNGFSVTPEGILKAIVGELGNYIIDSGGLRSNYSKIYPVDNIPDMMKEGSVILDLSKIKIEDSYGGSASYPQKHTQSILIESDKLTLTSTITGGLPGTNKTTSLTIKADGIYKDGVKVL